jgi:RHS repeat-associated protein
LAPAYDVICYQYHSDGHRVKSVINNETILFIGGHYEIKNPGSGQEVTKYYFAGAQRIAMRKYTIPQSSTLTYLLGDHLGSTSITTDNTGAKVSEMRYKPCPLCCTSGVLRKGEVRSWWTAQLATTPAYKLPDYTFTGQFSDSYINLLWYGSRRYDPELGRFISADPIVPNTIHGYDRYNYVGNRPPLQLGPAQNPHALPLSHRIHEKYFLTIL